MVLVGKLRVRSAPQNEENLSCLAPIREKLWLGQEEFGRLPDPEEEEEDLILFSTLGKLGIQRSRMSSLMLHTQL